MTTKFKKVTMPIFAGFVSIQTSVFFCFGMITGYFIAKNLSGKISSIQIPIGRYKIHVHHWMLALLGLITVAFTDTYRFFPPFALGFGGGFLFQGIYCYTDWHRILKKK